jgi:choline dehydrogenase-like flavoprotein
MENIDAQKQNSSTIDVLVVGSGPVGATIARTVADRVRTARILMVDAGPQLTARPGMHVKNILEPEELNQAQIRSQGPTQFKYNTPSFTERASAASQRGRERIAMLARPGTHLINPYDDDLDTSDMPAAAAATNVGGAGAHWTCACPRPGNIERVPYFGTPKMTIHSDLGVPGHVFGLEQIEGMGDERRRAGRIHCARHRQRE